MLWVRNRSNEPNPVVFRKQPPPCGFTNALTAFSFKRLSQRTRHQSRQRDFVIIKNLALLFFQSAESTLSQDQERENK
ncbi:hypothetical protein OIU79_030314 [Salix purpurea]|uniref:Uncharacterized protein n=1 Tax=Salix purpurea TaxID=77065 RepID=A0A9Q0V8V6_SALPP|nr:hypothetical protein OIU79_030314 [Salix purpurea]